MADALPNLDYAPPLPLMKRRRRRWIVRALLLSVAVAVAWRSGPGLFEIAQYRYLQYQCGSYEASAGKVVCDEPPRWAGATPPFLSTAADPSPLTAMIARWPSQYGGTFGPLLFMHCRKTAAGHERLVIIRRVPPTMRQSWDAPMAFDTIVMPRSTGLPTYSWSPGPRKLVEILPQIDRDDAKSVGFRFFAGQVDPADAAHFTIGYVADGIPGTIDGYLQDGPADAQLERVSVELKVRP